MERTWKNFRIDKRKVMLFIVKSIIWLFIYAGIEIMLFWGLMQTTVYR